MTEPAMGGRTRALEQRREGRRRLDPQLLREVAAVEPVLLDRAGQESVAAAFAKHGWGNLTIVYEELDERISYNVLRIARATLRGRQRRA